MITFLGRLKKPDSDSTIYSFEIIDKLIFREILNNLPDEIIKLLATKYAEEHGEEILKRIQEKTIDSKLIAKVVENLRKELKGGE